MKTNVVLCGFAGTGKTVVGRILAGSLQMEFADTNALIEERQRDRIARIIQVRGEQYFRDVEETVIRELSGGNNCVIALGEGALVRDDNRRRLKENGVIICLWAEPAVILLRTASSGDARLLLKSRDAIQSVRRIMETRESSWCCADWRIDTSNRTPEEVAEEIRGLLGGSGEL